jgi:predicted deacylase
MSSVTRLAEVTSLHALASASVSGQTNRIELHVDRLPDGSDLTIPVVVVRGPEPGPTVVITAGVHGDEFEGPLAIGKLLRTINPGRVRGCLVAVPAVNRLAFRAISRTTPNDSGNLNRLFPGSRDGSITERMAHVLTEGIVRGADALVDLHSGGTMHRFGPVAGARPEFPNLGLETVRLAVAFGGLPVWRIPAVAGVLSYEACRLGVPSIGVEVGGQAGATATDVELEVEALRRVLVYAGFLEGTPVVSRHATMEELPTPLPDVRTYATASGLYLGEVEIGDVVAQGERLGTIWGIEGEEVAVEISPADGIVAAVRRRNPVLQGEFLSLVLMTGDAGSSD